ncbi:hypothetical protein D3C78_1521100 [compost metagenome]
MGQVSQQLEVWHLREQIEGEQQVTGETIAVGFHQDRKVHLLGQTLPALDQFNGLRQRTRPDVCL